MCSLVVKLAIESCVWYRSMPVTGNKHRQISNPTTKVIIGVLPYSALYRFTYIQRVMTKLKSATKMLAKNK